ncbi:SDR family oxidoreductase [Thorsellia kenyensis]|uniref:SDR family oxidoreductase n=1 Tax=Thorsellia kenyensis TaxID=1549888 RepID=A0ABV6CBA7_9GAMM
MTNNKETVFITGAGRGLGFATASLLAHYGYNLILNFRKDQGKSRAGLNTFIANHPDTKVTLAKADISEPRDISMMVKKLQEEEGIEKIDHIILNAAAAPFKPLLEMTKNDWKLLLNTNLVGNISCLQNLVPMMNKGGTITLLSSLGSKTVLRDYPLGIVKSALENVVKYLEVELTDADIRVNGVCAGYVNTDMAPYLKELWPDIFAKVDKSNRRIMIEPIEIAEIIAFLISSKSSAIRGTTILADLGVTLEP